MNVHSGCVSVEAWWVTFVANSKRAGHFFASVKWSIIIGIILCCLTVRCARFVRSKNKFFCVLKSSSHSHFHLLLVFFHDITFHIKWALTFDENAQKMLLAVTRSDCGGSSGTQPLKCISKHCTIEEKCIIHCANCQLSIVSWLFLLWHGPIVDNGEEIHCAYPVTVTWFATMVSVGFHLEFPPPTIVLQYSLSK